MKVIMELTYVNLIVNCCSTILISSIFLRLSKQKYILIIVTILSYIVLISKYRMLCLIAMFILICKKNYRQLICSLTLYLCLVLFEYQNYRCFVEEYIVYFGERYIEFMCIKFTLFIILYLIYNVFYHKLFYRYYYRNVVLKIGEYVIKGNGYFDSGNMLTHQGVPVIFVSCREDSFDLKNVEAQEINIKTVNLYSKKFVYKGMIKVSYRWHDVLVGFREENKKYDFLLNVRLGE